MSPYEIPKEQWAQVVEKKGGPVVYKRIPVPTPSPSQVLLRIRYSGVCHTDLHAVRGDWPLPSKLPLVGGHEGVGEIVARGSLVDGEGGGGGGGGETLPLGALAGVKWLNGTCASCAYCRRGLDQLCPRPQLSGYTVDGSFQEYAVAQAAQVALIPRSVLSKLSPSSEGGGEEEAALAGVAPVLCAGLTVYRGLKESGARPGQTVAVVGAGGGLGTAAVQYARAMGLRVVAVDGGAGKGEVCRSLGAEAYVDFAAAAEGGDVVSEVRRAAGGDGMGPDAVLLVAVAEKPFQQAGEYVRPGGTIVCVGLPAGAVLKAPVFDTVTKMINIKGSYVGNRQDTVEALDFYARGLVKIPYKVVGLSELGEVYKMMEEGRITGRYVVDTSR